MAEKILIVDDEREITDLVALYLENERFTVYRCYTAKEAMNCIDSEKLDLAILDVMLPDMNGFEICKRIRRDYTYPVIMLTAKIAEVDRITGLTLGADDYVTKPFLPLELVARVKAQLRRYKQYNTGVQPDEDVVEYSGLVINAKTRECTLNEKPLSLTPTEFAILKILCQKRGSVVSAEKAVPVINGVPAIRRPQLTNMKNDNVFTSKYSLTDAQFQFSANGDLIAFDLDGAIDIIEIVNANVATLSMDELMERVQNHITLSDSGSYSVAMDTLESMEQDFGEEIVCNIDITQLEYGLTRVKVPDTDDCFYYLPAILLSGTINYCGVDTGMVYFSSDEMDDGPIVPLVCMNAVDGSIILIDNPAYD